MYYSDWNYAGIYAITHTETGRSYVGQSIHIAKRIGEHMYCSSKCTHLTKAIKKYGRDAFEARVLERVDDPEQLTAREQFWIDELQAASREYGFNALPAAGSPRGYKFGPHTDEARARISDALTGRVLSDEARKNISTGLMGRASWSKDKTLGPHSDETRARISAGLRESHARRKEKG